jgi:hypothetical protein
MTVDIAYAYAVSSKTQKLSIQPNISAKKLYIHKFLYIVITYSSILRHPSTL